MDTVMEVTVYGSGASDAAEEAERAIRRLEELWSVTREDSEISRLNRGETVELSEETANLLQKGLRLSEETGGALNLALYPLTRLWGFTTEEYRVPSREEIDALLDRLRSGSLSLEDNRASLSSWELDFGAVAKGYAAQLSADMLKERGVTSALLTLGGNVQTVGNKEDGSLWRIGVRDPWGEEGDYLGVLLVGEAAVVTSGAYQRYFEEDGVRYGHILDPETGRPVESGLASVTIVAEDGFLADGLSTALYVMGLEEATEFFRGRDDFEAVLVDDAGTIYVTEGLRDSFECSQFQVIER